MSSENHKSYYEKAFCRNLGLINPEEQRILQQSCVAIPGMGGMGGVHLATLIRSGIGNFSIADFDEFDIANMNRQYGASSSTVGKNKAEVMADIASDINPEVEIRLSKEGISPDNIDQFLDGADVVIDALDVFVPKARRLLFQKAREKGLYIVSAGPLGFGASLIIVSPTGMSYDDYFGIHDGMSEEEMILSFAVGIAPRGLHVPYMDMQYIDFKTGRAPSLGLACNIAAGVCATEIVNLLLKRRPVKTVPHYFQFDPYRMKYHKGYMPGGAKNPIQKIKKKILTNRIRKLMA